MVVALGVNAGFVTTAPVSDPVGSNLSWAGESRAIKVVTPAGSNRIIEIGFWRGIARSDNNFEVAIYSHDSGNDRPLDVIGIARVNNTGSGDGWIRSVVLDMPLTAETTYWLAAQIDAKAPNELIDFTGGGTNEEAKLLQSTLLDPWGISDTSGSRTLALYALIEEVSAGLTIQGINSMTGVQSITI